MSWRDQSRDIIRADQAVTDQPRRQRARKDRRRWCKGRVGTEHQPGAPVLSRYAASYHLRMPEGWLPCRWHYWYRGIRGRGWHWSCSHEIQCGTCGKILEHGLGQRCPDYSRRPTQVQHEQQQRRDPNHDRCECVCCCPDCDPDESADP